MRNRMLYSALQGVAAIQQLTRPHALDFMECVSKEIATLFRNGNKLLVAGNGGSLSDATHFAEEWTGYFRSPRQALPAIAISDPAHLTCVANDVGFDQVFSRGVEALGRAGDALVVLTTSGKSKNLIHAVEKAKEQKMTTIAFLGKGGGELLGVCDYELIIEGFSTSDRIQEAHMTAMHIIIEMVEFLLFPSEEEASPHMLQEEPAAR